MNVPFDPAATRRQRQVANPGLWRGVGRLVKREDTTHGGYLVVYQAKNQNTGETIGRTGWQPHNFTTWHNQIGDAPVEFEVDRVSGRTSLIRAAKATAEAAIIALGEDQAESSTKEQRTKSGSLDKLLQYMGAVDMDGHHLNVMMVGPAGCGKSTIARLAAEKLELPFFADSFNRDTPPWQLTGRREPTEKGSWEYVPSQFVVAYETGGVYLADEMDAADANTLLTLNMALANAMMAVPERTNKPIAKRHPNFHCIAAANTYGSGSRVYVGREELDEATLSRFVPLSVDYDKEYERRVLAKTQHGVELAGFRDKIRAAIDKSTLRRVYSTRHLIQWAALRDTGIPIAEIAAEYFKAWSVADLQAAQSHGVPHVNAPKPQIDGIRRNY